MEREVKSGNAEARKRHNERGSVFVESALILVVGLALVIATVDLSQMLFIHQAVVNQVRLAARWAAVNPYDATKIKNMVLYGTPAAGTHPLFGMNASNIAVEHDTSDGLYADRVTIRVSGYSYLLFSAALANVTRAGAPAVRRTGLTATMTIPHEHIF
jgi:hypothetical protein